MPTLTITETDIEGWKARKEEIEKEIKQLNREFNEIERKLEVVNLLTKEEPGRAKPGYKLALILGILRQKQRYLAPQEIKEILIERGIPEEEWGPKYVYVHQVLSRLQKKGWVKKSPNGHKYKADSESFEDSED